MLFPTWTAVASFGAALVALTATAINAQQQAAGTPLFLNEPACNSYQCAVLWHAGDHVAINWLNAPNGDVQLSLVYNPPNATAYNISAVPGISQAGYCDAGAGLGVAVDGVTCGRFEFVVPSDWAIGNYSVSAHSLKDTSLASYTDTVLILPPSSNSTQGLSALAGSFPSSSVSFSTITINGAPTSTSSAWGAKQITDVPTPTAPTSPGAFDPRPTPKNQKNGTGSGGSTGADGSGSQSATKSNGAPSTASVMRTAAAATAVALVLVALLSV